MVIERIGFRQLYEALGVTVQEQGELVRVFEFPDGARADVVTGPRVRYGFSVHKTSGYTVPDADGVCLSFRRVRTPEEAGLGGRCFTDIIVSQDIEVPEDVSRTFRAKDALGHNAIFVLMRPLERKLRSFAEFVAGFMGLRFHRQLVLRLVCEENFIFRSEGDPAVNSASPAIENLDAVGFKPSAPSDSLKANAGKPLEIALATLPWLLRAWRTSDSVSRFIALFVPLEVCLSGIGGERSAEVAGALERLRGVAETAGGRKDELLAALAVVEGALRPTLSSRFEALAKEAKLPGWEQDVEAFRRFNHIRNDLFHRGNRDVRLILPAKQPSEGVDFDAASADFQDIVERYVCYRLMGDAQVYPSRWYPRRPYPS